MPGGDKTGPTGQGPMTGRAAGYCTGTSTPGYMNPAPGRVFGNPGRSFRGRGGGGWRNRFFATGMPGRARGGWDFGLPAPYGAQLAPSMTREQEIGLLREQASRCNESLESIKKRIEELSPQKSETQK